MYKALEVSLSGYYHWLKEALSKRKMKDMELKEEIRRIFGKSRKSYGSRRIYQQLLQD
jgi:hypothetical protein